MRVSRYASCLEITVQFATFFRLPIAAESIVHEWNIELCGLDIEIFTKSVQFLFSDIHLDNSVHYLLFFMCWLCSFNTFRKYSNDLGYKLYM